MSEKHGPLESILAIAEGSFHAADLAERDLAYIDPRWRVIEALERMDALNIDVAPLREDPTRRYCVRDELRRTVGSRKVDKVSRVVDIGHLVTGDVGLGEALELLEDRGFLFTIEGGRVTGIITPADVQRTPVSMVVLGVILAAEAGMSRLITTSYGSEDIWLAMLPAQRVAKLESRFVRRTQRNAETQRLDLLMLEDRLTIIAKQKDLREAIGFSARGRFERWAHLLQSTRDQLAHGGSLLDVEPDPTTALQLVRHVREFATAVWRAAA